MMTRMAPVTRESEIVKQVHLRLGSRADVRLWRFQAGVGRVGARDTVQRFCPTGFPDLAGWVTICGVAVWLGVECKTESGRLSEAQSAWKKWADEAGAIYIVARDAARAEMELEAQIEMRSMGAVRVAGQRGQEGAEGMTDD